jgi:hypothetical protein
MRRYNFKNVFNCRDIGGYFTENHHLVKNHVFLRADNLTGLLIFDTRMKSIWNQIRL